jgi:hypothetical protein
VKIQHDFLALRDLAVYIKKYMFFYAKPGILIPDLYFYDIKIKTNIKKNLVEKYMKKLQVFKRNFFEIFLELGRTRPNYFFLWTGLGPNIRLGQN